MSRTFLLRRGGAAVGMYTATALGFLATIVAGRELPKDGFGTYAIVLGAITLLQLVFDITAEEAAVKYGYRYQEQDDWGRFRQLFRVLLAVKWCGGLLGATAIAGAALLSHAIYGKSGLVAPMLIGALLPLVQAPEGIAGAMLLVRGRYDVRGWFLAFSMALRLAAVAVTAPHGVVWILVGMTVAQGLSTVAIFTAGLRALARFPRPQPAPLGPDAAALRRFVFHSTLGSSLVSLRSTLPMNLVGGIMSKPAAADFRAAQAPQTALTALAGPGRLILLSEQSRHFEAGRADRVYGMIRRYMLLSAVPLVVLVPVGWVAMPWLLAHVLKADYRSAADTARLILLAGAIQIVWGWTRPFAIAIGRPGLRALTYAVELAVLVPALLVLGSRYGAAGAAGGVLAGSVAFAAVWTVLLVRLRNRPLAAARSVEAV